MTNLKDHLRYDLLPRESAGAKLCSWLSVLWRARHEVAMLLTGIAFLACLAVTVWDAVTPASWPRPVEVSTGIGAIVGAAVAAWMVVVAGRMSRRRS